jgi:predicted DNA binding CopG/RHH family protein
MLGLREFVLAHCCVDSAITTTTIRLDPEDISRARALAAKRGLCCQTYLKMLIHEALETEAKRLAS